MHDHSTITTFLFSDIEGSTQLWEREAPRMEQALARHDALARAAVEGHHGHVVKMTGDGMCAAFDDPQDAVAAALEFQQWLAAPGSPDGLALRARCGLHAGIVERRDNDFFGTVLNRTARIMAAAHGGQVLVSQALSALLVDRLPPGIELLPLGAVRLRDLASPESVFQMRHPSLRGDFPALRSLSSTPNNLPQQVTSFIGREREVSELRQGLRKGRLVTILGAGGLGKTRLSLQAAADVMDDYPDGIWLVELAPIADARMVPQAIASVLGVKEETGRPVLDALANAVKDRRLLVILDNCEHLLAACADTCRQLLQAGPHLRILASSREPLHVAGEATFPLPVLAMPDVDQTVPSSAVAQYEAVHLFLDRAAAVLPSFRVTDQNATTIVDICRRLDGIPLAIELAAARVRAMSVQTIAERLTNRFGLLTGGDRTALRRQQTLRASIDWSHDLLTDQERIVFRRLAVFAGGWTLEAAERVCSGDGVAEGDVLTNLADLVDKSLVMVDAGGGRYGFLETVRQYATERLANSPDGDATRSRHLAHFLAMAESVAPQLLGPEQATALLKLDLERENVLSAHALCVRTEGAGELAYRLVIAVKHYWFMRGLLNLGHHVTVEAISIPAPSPLSLARCRALWVAGQICSFTGRCDEALRYLHEGLAIARHHDDRRMIAAVQTVLAQAALGLGDRVSARAHCEEALDCARELGGKREIAVASNALAQLNRLDGKLDAAQPLYEEAVALAHDLDDREFAALGMLGLAMVAIGHGSPWRARELLIDALAIADATGSQPAAQSALEVSVGLAALENDWDRSARLYGAAEAQALRTGIRRDPADEAFLLPMLDRTRQALGDTEFRQAEASGRNVPFEKVMTDVRGWLSSNA